MKALITCKQAVDFISRKEEGKITGIQRFELWKHLAVCSLCRTFSRQNRLMIDALKKSSTPTSIVMSEADKEAIQKQFTDP